MHSGLNIIDISNDFFNNPFSSFYPWSFPPSNFLTPGSNWDRDFYQSRNNGPNSYSFIYNDWQLNFSPQVIEGPFRNFSESASWDVLPLFGLIKIFLKDESAVVSIEYALITCLISLAILSSQLFVGKRLMKVFKKIAKLLKKTLKKLRK